jgi:hypothetical protein
VALAIGVLAGAGARTDRMPGIEACAPATSDADAWVVDGWAADGWATVGCGPCDWDAAGCAAGVSVSLGVGVTACAGARTDRMPGIDACGPEG